MVDSYKKKGKLTAVIAVRKGSQRVPDKNIRPFADTNLLELKIKVLKNCKLIDEIIINSDSEKMLEIGKQYGLKTKLRDDYFASNEATNSEFHGHIAETTDTDFIFLTPVCSPFISSKIHDDAIEKFMLNTNDSLTSTNDVIGHLWLDGKPLNYRLDNVPNSQDLPKIKMLNYGISIIEKNSMSELKALIGHKPSFFALDSFQSIDINTVDEFTIAETLYKNNIISDLISY